MARINKQAVVNETTQVARRVHFVAKDPAVIKAAKQAGRDLAHAGRSSAALVSEVRSSWQRSV